MNDNTTIGGQTVYGVYIDPQSRCAHWNSPLDIVALRFACCGDWYSCYDCHAELAEHEPQVWPRSRFDELAAMCGACGHKLSVSEYTSGDPACPACGAAFNPGCAKHYHLYFEWD